MVRLQFLYLKKVYDTWWQLTNHFLSQHSEDDHITALKLKSWVERTPSQ